MTHPVLALDIGGANLKAAHSSGAAWFRPFPVWKHPHHLSDELGHLVAQSPRFDLLAVTMTAELCDCFSTKHEGVNAILDAVERAASGARVLVWQNDGALVSAPQARRDSLKTAAANWLALATFAGRLCSKEPALLIDIGSTTTDIIPLCDGRPIPQGRTDLERLAARELVYMGVSRTPLAALLATVTWRGRSFAPAAEFFATTQDAYLLLGDLLEAPENRDTTDGRPATRAFSRARLARMLCADADTLTEEEVQDIARQVRDQQIKKLTAAIRKVSQHLLKRPQACILAGAGEFLAAQTLRSRDSESPRVISLAKELGAEGSRAACAYALAVLTAERMV